MSPHKVNYSLCFRVSMAGGAGAVPAPPILETGELAGIRTPIIKLDRQPTGQRPINYFL